MNKKLFAFLGTLENISEGELDEYKTNESEKLGELQNELYDIFIEDLEFSCQPGDTSILFHIPAEHAYMFVQRLQKRQQDTNSFLFEKKVEVVVLDTSSIEGCAKYQEDIKQDYEKLLELVKQHDKFIEVYNSLRQFQSYADSDEDRSFIVPLDNSFKAKNQVVGSPRMKTYFPNEDQAATEGMSLEEYYRFYISTLRMDWGRIREANKELVKLFQEYDRVEMKGTYADISFDISGMGARNSVIETNYPGCEVFSCPTIDGVNGWIEYHNPVYYHYTGDIITGLRVEFEENILQDIEIFGTEDAERKEELTTIIKNYFAEKEGNKRVGELAFGTNFFIPTGVKQILVGEKAFGMHFAFGKALPFEGTDNGNQDTTIHWDLIRDMSDDIVVSFHKNSGESLVLMKDGVFTQEALPKIYEYYSEVKK